MLTTTRAALYSVKLQTRRKVTHSDVSLRLRRFMASSSGAVPATDSASQWLVDKDPEQVAAMQQELIPVVDIQDRVIGARAKADCHLMANIEKGLLHRAFSVLLYNSSDQFLLTQRTATKITFPGYYTNACCSHPAASIEEVDPSDEFIGSKRAAKRRLVFELGIKPEQLSLNDIHFMTRIVYKAGSDDPVWGEHELDHVLVIKKDLDVNPNPCEVMSWQYVNQQELEHLLGMFTFLSLIVCINDIIDVVNR